MSKPSIQNITTTQTFQNWFDKTNEMVDIMRDSSLTASGTGDITVGDAVLQGEFTANTVIVFNDLLTDFVETRTPGATLDFGSPVKITPALSPIAATFAYGVSGAKTRYTDNITAWDIGYDSSAAANFQMVQGGVTAFSLSPAGVLTVPSIVTSTDVEIGTDLRIDGLLTSNTATFVAASGNFSGDFSGDFVGDVYAPGGTAKVFENGNGTTIPATFTGNVNGTVSSLSNHKTTNLTEGTKLYFTTARARDSLTGSTGVTYSKTTGEIAIGQSVGTAADVLFNTVTATGNITAFGSVSDRTMKENITPIENALDKVSQLGGYNFNYIGDDTPMTGVMAQELLEVLPGAVYKTIDPKTNKEVFAVRHGNVIGLLIEAIKELQEKVGK